MRNSWPPRSKRAATSLPNKRIYKSCCLRHNVRTTTTRYAERALLPHTPYHNVQFLLHCSIQHSRQLAVLPHLNSAFTAQDGQNIY